MLLPEKLQLRRGIQKAGRRVSAGAQEAWQRYDAIANDAVAAKAAMEKADAEPAGARTSFRAPSKGPGIEMRMPPEPAKLTNAQ